MLYYRENEAPRNEHIQLCDTIGQTLDERERERERESITMPVASGQSENCNVYRERWSRCFVCLVAGLPERKQQTRVRTDFPIGAFSQSWHTSTLTIGSLPGAWRDRVSARTGWSSASIL